MDYRKVLGCEWWVRSALPCVVVGSGNSGRRSLEEGAVADRSMTNSGSQS